MKIIWIASGSRATEEGISGRLRVGVEVLRCVGNSEETGYLPPLSYCLTVASTKLKNCGKRASRITLIY